MVCDDRLIEWDAPPRRSAPSIVDDRILTSCAVVCARMDGWWTLAAGNREFSGPSSHGETAIRVLPLRRSSILRQLCDRLSQPHDSKKEINSQTAA